MALSFEISLALFMVLTHVFSLFSESKIILKDLELGEYSYLILLISNLLSNVMSLLCLFFFNS